MSDNQISVSTPQVLWHGGGNENGKPDPVYSVDFHPQEPVMCTTGIDANVPPKGSVRLWKVESNTEGQEFMLDLCDHQSAVNVARFSPDGKMLASASERQIVVYVVSDPSVWSHIADVVPLERIWLRPALNEVFDIQWSPDSTHLVVGAIDCKAEIIRLATRDSLMLPGHISYIQGVAWDPRGEHVVTQSADRSCKVHKIKHKAGSTVKLAPRGHVVMRMHLGYTAPDSAKKVLTAADFGVTETTVVPGANGEAASSSSDAAAAPSAAAGINLFADSFVPSFFRRVVCSPDGALIIAPTGIHRPPNAPKTAPGSRADATAPGTGNSYCTHVFARDNLASPCVSLVGLEEPSIAVRCCLRPYKLIPHGGESMIPGAYRFVFAVVTLSSVFVYDTQHTHPLAKFAGLHYAPINDAAWSEDGRVLAVCSSDGYLSFFRFEPGALGEFLEDALVSEVIKKAQPCLFKYTPPVVDETAAAAAAVAAEAQEAKEDKDDKDAEEAAGLSANNSATSAGSADAEADAKKRKRIQPTAIASLDTTTASTNSTDSVAAALPTPLLSGAAESTSASSSAAPVKIKKRIAPQHLPDNTLATANTPSNTSAPVTGTTEAAQTTEVTEAIDTAAVNTKEVETVSASVIPEPAVTTSAGEGHTAETAMDIDCGEQC